MDLCNGAHAYRSKLILDAFMQAKTRSRFSRKMENAILNSDLNFLPLVWRPVGGGILRGSQEVESNVRSHTPDPQRGSADPYRKCSYLNFVLD